MRKIPLQNSAWGLPRGHGDPTQPHLELMGQVQVLPAGHHQWPSNACRSQFTATPHCKKWLLSLPSLLRALREITFTSLMTTVLTAQAGVPSLQVSISEVHQSCHLLQSFHPVGLENPRGDHTVQEARLNVREIKAKQT